MCVCVCVCVFRIIETLLSTSLFKETHWEGYYLYLSTLFYWGVKKAFDFLPMYLCVRVCVCMWLFMEVSVSSLFKWISQIQFSSVFPQQCSFVSSQRKYCIISIMELPLSFDVFIYFCFNKFNTFCFVRNNVTLLLGNEKNLPLTCRSGTSNEKWNFTKALCFYSEKI